MLKQQAAVKETGDSSPSQRQDSSSWTLPIIYSSECLATDDNWWLLFFINCDLTRSQVQNLNLSEKAKMRTEYFVFFYFWKLGLYSPLVQTNRDGIIYDMRVYNEMRRNCTCSVTYKPSQKKKGLTINWHFFWGGQNISELRWGPKITEITVL